MQGSNEVRLVETVTTDGELIGSHEVLSAHTERILHRAVSVMLRREDGLWLFQQRAAEKPLFPSFWANSCCTHPFPGEAPAAAAERRVFQELGMKVTNLRSAGTFVYSAECPITGRFEHEFDHVFVGTCEAEANPDPAEISTVLWSQGTDGLAPLAPWAATVFEMAALVRD